MPCSDEHDWRYEDDKRFDEEAERCEEELAMFKAIVVALTSHLSLPYVGYLLPDDSISKVHQSRFLHWLAEQRESTAKQSLREAALSKLSDDEKRALNLI